MPQKVKICHQKEANAWLQKYDRWPDDGAKNVIEIMPHPKGVMIVYED